MLRTRYITTNETDVFSSGAYFVWCLEALGGIGREYHCTNDSYESTLQSIGRLAKNILGNIELVLDSEKTDWFRFQNLVEQWKTERGARSSITEAAMMPAYQEIIGMGSKAVPLILEQIRSEGDEPDQWFWALRAITGENPVKPEDQGNFQKMAEAWLQWSQQLYAW